MAEERVQRKLTTILAAKALDRVLAPLLAPA